MAKKLDFIVLGMPRGGTSATARYLSAIDGMHCGQEVFPVSLDHATLDIPSAFTDPNLARNESSVQTVRERGHEISIWGNKTPTYFYRYEGILEELDNCPSVVCLRNPESVARSYSTRAKNPKDNWHSARHGIYAAGDALMLAHALIRVKTPEKVMLLPQNALLKDDLGSIEQVAKLIAPGHPVTFRDDALNEIEQIKARQGGREKTELSQPERRALVKMHKSGLNALFDRDEPFLLSSVKEELKGILEQCPPNPVGFIRRIAEEAGETKETSYFPKWSRLASRAVARWKEPATI